MMMTKRSLGILALSAALLACGTGDAKAQDAKKAASPATGFIVGVRAGDAEMNAAIARAHATTDELLARLRHPSPAQTYLGVKVQFANERAGEHIWLYEVRLDGDHIVGRLLDDAEHFPQYHRGDVIRVLPSEISDWMTVENGRACGGFTMRVLMRRLSADQRKAYLRSMRVPRLPPGDRLCDTEDGG